MARSNKTLTELLAMSDVDKIMDKHAKEIESLRTKLLDDFSYYLEVTPSAQVLLIAAEQALATLFEEHCQSLDKIANLLDMFQGSDLKSDKPKPFNWKEFCEEEPAYPGCKDFDL
jgi:hypothetical protein